MQEIGDDGMMEQIGLVVATIITCVTVGTGAGMVIKWYFNF